MRVVVAVVLALLLGSGAAAAFECAGVKLPSSIVICSDPELIRLADERQAAINEARGRIGEERWPELWDNQKAWVRSYAAACGVPPDGQAPSPVPATIKECFKRAAEARTAYLRAYGSGTGATAQNSAAAPLPFVALHPSHWIGPSFDCGKAQQPLAMMICADAGLSLSDLRYVQAYQALRQQLAEDQQRELRTEAINFVNSVIEQCGLPGSGPMPPLTSVSRDCIGNAYDQQRSALLSRLTPPGSEEASRPIERHLSLQRGLQELGYLPATAAIDGVYGPATRAAITAWQTAASRPARGFLGDDDAGALWEQTSATVGPVANIRSQPQDSSGEPAGRAGLGDEIPLELSNGVYSVPVRINGVLPLAFTLDTGAADVVLPADVFLTLLRTGTVREKDYIGEGEYRLADGSTVKSHQFYIRELKVGTHVVKDVAASVEGIYSRPLLGQSFLSKVDLAIDNSRHVLILYDRSGTVGSNFSAPSAAAALPTTTSRPSMDQAAGRPRCQDIGCLSRQLREDMTEAEVLSTLGYRPDKVSLETCGSESRRGAWRCKIYGYGELRVLFRNEDNLWVVNGWFLP